MPLTQLLGCAYAFTANNTVRIPQISLSRLKIDYARSANAYALWTYEKRRLFFCLHTAGTEFYKKIISKKVYMGIFYRLANTYTGFQKIIRKKMLYMI